MNTLKKVLVVDDNESLQRSLKNVLSRHGIIVLSALTIGEAEELFSANPDVNLIVMDACVPGDRPNTISLVQKIRQKYAGPMIACSSLREYRHLLIEAGCDQEASKLDLPTVIKKILT
jgi:CheY-like chemotaxis protein